MKKNNNNAGLFILVFCCFILFCVAIGIYSKYQQTYQGEAFLNQFELECRKVSGYIEKDRGEGKHAALKQAFCWDKSGEKLLFKKQMKYE